MKVKERMLGLDPIEHGEPTYFFLMMQAILLLNGEARCPMINCLKSMSLYNFEGKNNGKASTQILGAMHCLELITSILVDITDKIINIFLTRSVAAFTSLFEAMKNNAVVAEKAYIPEHICKIAKR
eukprot:7129139-Ditylum_brightwellii.AAC.1